VKGFTDLPFLVLIHVISLGIFYHYKSSEEHSITIVDDIDKGEDYVEMFCLL